MAKHVMMLTMIIVIIIMATEVGLHRQFVCVSVSSLSCNGLCANREANASFSFTSTLNASFSFEFRNENANLNPNTIANENTNTNTNVSANSNSNANSLRMFVPQSPCYLLSVVRSKSCLNKFSLPPQPSHLPARSVMEHPSMCVLYLPISLPFLFSSLLAPHSIFDNPKTLHVCPSLS